MMPSFARRSGGARVKRSTTARSSSRERRARTSRLAGTVAEGIEAEGLADYRSWLSSLGRTGVTTDGGRKVLAGSEVTVSGWRDPLTPPMQTGLRWLVVHHEPPEETAVATDKHSDFGSFDSRQELENQQPDVLFCGHQHTPTRWHDRVGKTLCLNPGRSTHPAVPNFIVYDDQSKRAAFHVGGEVQTVLRLT